MKYALVKWHNQEEWLIHLPGARLDPWGTILERAEFNTLEDAVKRRVVERAERYADIVEIPDNVKCLRTYRAIRPATDRLDLRGVRHEGTDGGGNKTKDAPVVRRNTKPKR